MCHNTYARYTYTHALAVKWRHMATVIRSYDEAFPSYLTILRHSPRKYKISLSLIRFQRLRTRISNFGLTRTLGRKKSVLSQHGWHTDNYFWTPPNVSHKLLTMQLEIVGKCPYLLTYPWILDNSLPFITSCVTICRFSQTYYFCRDICHDM